MSTDAHPQNDNGDGHRASGPLTGGLLPADTTAWLIP